VDSSQRHTLCWLLTSASCPTKVMEEWTGLTRGMGSQDLSKVSFSAQNKRVSLILVSGADVGVLSQSCPFRSQTLNQFLRKFNCVGLSLSPQWLIVNSAALTLTNWMVLWCLGSTWLTSTGLLRWWYSRCLATGANEFLNMSLKVLMFVDSSFKWYHNYWTRFGGRYASTHKRLLL